MALFNDNLNMIAVNVAKVIKLLDELESQIRRGEDVYDHKEDFMLIAYVCRIGIIERIDNMNLSSLIFIPMGLFRTKKMTIALALEHSVGRLKGIANKDIMVYGYVEDILDRRGIFHEFDRIIPLETKKQL